MSHGIQLRNASRRPLRRAVDAEGERERRHAPAQRNRHDSREQTPHLPQILSKTAQPRQMRSAHEPPLVSPDPSPPVPNLYSFVFLICLFTFAPIWYNRGVSEAKGVLLTLHTNRKATKMKQLLIAGLSVLSASVACAAPEVSNVVMTQGADRNVTVTYDLAGEDAVPRMSLRLRMENTRTAEQWQKTLAALAANPGCCDEVWFSTGIGLPPMETHRAHVEELKRAAADLLALGITPSLQIQATLGHGDKFSALADCSAKTWGGWTGSTGVEDRLCSCPRQPGFLAYMREMAKTYAAFKPGSVWIDDDLRIDNHAPATDGSLNGCWCATCLAAFGAKEGRTWEHSALAEAVAKDAAIAARWKAFSVEAIVTVAGVIAEVFHRLSPKTTMAFQHCFNDADIDSVRAVATTLAQTSGHLVGLRPGGGSYYDINPCEQIVKSIRAAQFRGRVADLPNVGIWCPEVESCPRAYGSRSAQSILVESFIAMAYGFNSTSLLVTDTRTETEAFVAETILKPLAAAQPVLVGFARANEGTVPAGFSTAGLSPWQIYRYAISGIPVLPGVGYDLGALTKEDLALDVCQVGSATVQRTRDALDALVKGVPATLESPFVGLMVPHVTASGALRTVALLNTRIDAQGPVTLRLRGVPANATLTWRALRCAPLPLTVTRTGDVVRVTIPEIKAWNGGFIDIVESE